jgi:hypothetical protein
LLLPLLAHAQPAFITLLYPPQHGLNIPPDAVLRVSLREALDPASLSDSAIYVWSDITGLHRLTVTLENDNKDLCIVPRHWRVNDRLAFNAGERVTVTLTARLRFADGRPFEGFTWHYTVAVRQNHGGDFKPEALFGGDASTYFYVADFNGDGWADLIGDDVIQRRMVIFLNNGKGILGFHHRENIVTPSGETVDLNRDGNQDVICCGNRWTLNDGNAHFIEKVFLDRPNSFAKAHDFNNDGMMDFAMGNVVSDTLYFGLSTNGEPFAKLQKVIPPIRHPTFYYHGISYDLTNDGRIDFVYVAGFGGGSEIVGFASFQATAADSLKLLQVRGLTYEQINFYGNDFDNDQDIDYAFVPGGADDNYITFFNDGSGQLNPSSLKRDPLDTRLAETVEGGDFDGDGDIDLAFASTNRISVMPESFAPDVSIYLNDGNGGFLLANRIRLPFDRPLNWVLRAVDLDMDGDLDLNGIANGLFYIVANGSYANAVTDEQISLTPIQFFIKGIYPNPAQKQTTIEIELPKSIKEEVTLTIFDLTGRSVRSWAINQRVGSIQANWDLRDQKSNLLSNGVYFVQVRMGKFTARQKLLVLK